MSRYGRNVISQFDFGHFLMRRISTSEKAFSQKCLHHLVSCCNHVFTPRPPLVPITARGGGGGGGGGQSFPAQLSLHSNLDVCKVNTACNLQSKIGVSTLANMMR